MFLPAGNLHAYLSGAGIEVMASSDNVLRGGLTGKHVDLAALIEVLDFTDGRVPVIHPVLGPGRAALPGAGRGLRPDPLPARRRSRARSPPAAPRCCCAPRERAVLSSADGELTLEKGDSAFVPAGAPVSARGPAVLTGPPPTWPERPHVAEGASCVAYSGRRTSPAEASACSLIPQTAGARPLRPAQPAGPPPGAT